MTYAMILCAGFGTRLNDLTKDTPKPMLMVGNKPMLEHTILHLKTFGVNRFVINLHYLSEKITSYFGNGEKLGVEITYSCEEAPLGTAGAVKKVENILKNSENFFVIYGDILTDMDYGEFLEFHLSKNSPEASIIVHERVKSNSIVEIEENNMVKTFIERPPADLNFVKTQNWVNSGIYLFNKSILKQLPEGFSDFPKDIFPKLLEAKTLYAKPISGYRCAVDSVERYNMLKSDYKNGKLNLKGDYA